LILSKDFFSETQIKQLHHEFVASISLRTESARLVSYVLLVLNSRAKIKKPNISSVFFNEESRLA